MERLRDYLLEHNKHYLLACYLLHYVLIRPKEISMLKIKDINLCKQTITITAVVSKNKKNGRSYVAGKSNSFNARLGDFQISRRRLYLFERL